MDSNIHSARASTRRPDRLAGLAAAIDEVTAQDLDGLTDAALAEQVLGLRRLVDRLEGHWLSELAAVDGRCAAGADQDIQAASTASWLRNRLHMGAGAARSSVRTARALFRGPLTATAQALTAGEISPAHARVLAAGTQDLPDHVTAAAEPVLVETAGRLDPPRLRRVLDHLRLVADPDGADRQAERRHEQRGGGWPRPGRAWSPCRGCWSPRLARPCWPLWNPWPARPTLRMGAVAASVGLMPCVSWPAALWRGTSSPRPAVSAPS
jgi:hypothetical protein